MVKLNDDRMTYVNMNKFYDIALGKYIYSYSYIYFIRELYVRTVMMTDGQASR